MNKLQNIVNYKWFPYVFFLIAIIISVIQHYRIFSLDIIGIHCWRQTQTQTVIENFANEDFNILNPRLNDLYYKDRLFRMEFPLAQWLIAALMKIFGNYLIITRLFFFTITIISVLGMYKLLFLLTNLRITALLSSWFFLFSPILYYYSLNPIPDNLALCFGIWSIYFWINYLNTNKNYCFMFSCLFLALSIAVKLPFIVFGGMYLAKIYNANKKKIELNFIIFPAIICLPSLVWYFNVIGNWTGNGIVLGMLDNKNSSLNLLDIFIFNVGSTLPELLINYATLPLFIIGLYFTIKQLDVKNKTHLSFLFGGCLCIFYFLFELNMIDKVHDYYLFPFLPFLFVVVAKSINSILFIPKTKLNILIILAFILCPLTAYLRCNTRWNNYDPGFSSEILFYKKQIQSLIPNKEKLIVHGDVSRSIVLYHLNRHGWSYSNEGLSENNIKDNTKDGAKYFITNFSSDTNAIFIKYLDTLLFIKNDVKLYKLK